LIEQAVAKIDDGRAPVIAKNAVKQRHLTARAGDVDRTGQTRKTGGQGRLARIKIIADQGTDR